jgi:hypothetical protein
MISVCIATYNGEKYIKEQILSILAQLSTKDEIIISDDGSTDHTITKILEISSPIIKIVYNQNEHGYTANFENALKNAKGNFIFLSDQDDIWEPNKVACCMEHFKKYDSPSMPPVWKTLEVASFGTLSKLFCNMMDVTEILNTIVDVYQSESVTVSELMEILSKCGFSREETREIIRYAINAKLMGRVSYRKMGKNMIGSNTVVVLKKKKNF